MRMLLLLIFVIPFWTTAAQSQGFPGFTHCLNGDPSPPDAEIAAGPNHLVVVDNFRIAYFDKSGTLLDSYSLTSPVPTCSPHLFWTQQPGLPMGAIPEGNFFSDPEVHYDEYHHRFWLVYFEYTLGGGDPVFLFAVSDDDNPLGVWYK